MAAPPFLDSADPGIYVLRTRAPGPAGRLPLDAATLASAASGTLFGLTQNAGMGWDPRRVIGREFLILSTQGGIRAPDGTPVALGYHTGHWEVGLLMEAAARTLSAHGAIPFAGYCSDPCDGRTQRHAGHDRQPALSERRRHCISPSDPLAPGRRGASSGWRRATRACRR